MTNLPVWNLEDFYTDIGSNKINSDLDYVKRKSQSFNKKYKNKLKSLNNDLLKKSIIEYEHIQEKIQFIHSFSFLTYCTHQIDSKKTKFYQDMEEKLNRIQVNLIFLHSKLVSYLQKN